MGKTWRREGKREERFTLGEAMGLVEPAEPRTGPQQYTASTAVASDADVKAALEAAYKAKAFMGLRARGADVEFAAQLGLQLRKDSKGRDLALQSEDLPKSADWRLTVKVAGRDGNPIEVRLGGCVRHNRALGLAVAAGRLLSADRKRNPTVATEAKLLGMELANMRATPQERKAAFAAFYGPHTVRVELSSAKEFLTALEPVPVSRRQELRKELRGDALQRVDALLAVIRQSRGK